MKKRGFSLIELSIVTIISSILIVGIYNIIKQVKITTISIIDIIDADTNYIAFYNQIFKDISSIIVPDSSKQFYKEIDKNENNKKNNITDNNKDKETQNKEKAKVIKDIFYISKDESENIFLSFITTGGFKPIDKDGNIDLKRSLIKRVAYIFKKRGKIIDIFYKETDSSLELNFIRSENVKEYKLGENFKDINFSFMIFEYTDKKIDKNKLKQNPISKWDEDSIYKKYKILVPAYISIEGSIVNKLEKKQYEFKLNFKVYAYNRYDQKELIKNKDLNKSQQIDQQLTNNVKNIENKDDNKTKVSPGKI
jgi:prepilin-type N-terminal cleavage/methylation domain-containing protein